MKNAMQLKAVITRGDQNTRPRDYYDVYILVKLQLAKMRLDEMKLALLATARKRGSTEILMRYHQVINMVRNSKVMHEQWLNYQKDFEFAEDVEFEETCNAVEHIMDRMFLT